MWSIPVSTHKEQFHGDCSADEHLTACDPFRSVHTKNSSTETALLMNILPHVIHSGQYTQKTVPRRLLCWWTSYRMWSIPVSTHKEQSHGDCSADEHLTACDPFRSVHTENSSTETALLMNILPHVIRSSQYTQRTVPRRLLCCELEITSSCRDDKKAVVLTLLDLSDVFDTIAHETLISCLEVNYGIKSIALDRMRSYPDERMQYVAISTAKSQLNSLECSVPPGSIIGPKAFKHGSCPV